MARKYALIQNNIVIAVETIDDDKIDQYSKTHQMIIDIEDIVPQPTINWVLNGNILEIPAGNSDLEKFEELLAEKKIIRGIKLARIAIIKVGARNKILKKSATQVSTLLNQLVPIKMLLETGALGTARDNCRLLKNVYTEYSDIFQLVIDDIDLFERDLGL